MSSCVVVLCGLPASGKTTLARFLVNHINKCGLLFDVEHVCFDALLSRALERSSVTGVE